MMKKLAVVAVMATLPALAHANLVSNGDFASDLSSWNDTGTLSGSAGTPCDVLSSNCAEWSALGKARLFRNSSQAFFYQTVTNPYANSSFTLSFDLDVAYVTGQDLDVSFDGNLVWDASMLVLNVDTDSDMIADAFSGTITVNGLWSNTTGDIEFGYYHDRDGWYIDNVSLEVTEQRVPEPATGALTLAALGLLGVAARRRRALVGV